MVGKLRTEEILYALWRRLPRILIKKGTPHILHRDQIRFAVQTIAVSLFAIITERGRNLEKLKKPMIVRGESQGTPRLVGCEQVALFIFLPEGGHIKV